MKKISTTKILIAFLFINCTLLELFTGWVTVENLILARDFGTTLDFTPLVTLIGIVLGEVSETASNLFWTFFSLSLVTLLISYIPLFLAFLKLRKTDKTERVYKVPGSDGFIKVFAIVPFVLLILGVVFTLFGDFTGEYISENMPLIIGVVVSFIVEEILVARVKNK